ncbi:MAG TPA: hypothetical protein VM533_02745 [Fimbriiglobus sp.]|jgi:hypothetical protein|nr:hypothetical protein [Fimbriiglobus sp.]
MSESELQKLIAVPEPPADEPSPAKSDLAPDQALELVRAGKVVENARVKRLKLRGDFEQPVRFRNCVLVQCEFDGAVFRQDVAFVACTLDRPTFSKPSTFEKNLDLGHSVVNKAIVSRLTVRGKLTAPHAEFRGRLTVADCEFGQGVSFWEAKFATWVDFSRCEFRDVADFRSVQCDQGFVLTKCVFLGDFLFRGSCVEKKFQADGSRFEKLLDLSKAKLHDYVYLEAIEPGPAQSFAFLNAVAERIRVRPEQVEGRLDSEAAGRHEEAMQEYGLLKRCYQALHRFDSEDWAFYRFKVNQRKAKPLSWARPWTVWRAFGDWLFLDVGCGYGTSPIRAVRMALVIILGFAALYATNVEMFYAEKRPYPDLPVTDPANRVMIGLITSVSVFTSGMGGIREIAQGWMNVPVMVESIMGTLLFGLFIVAFSRKVIR